eukprot:COSAG01_NODE_66503_length_270_cov_0.543860_1_plen_54_part_01
MELWSVAVWLTGFSRGKVCPRHKMLGAQGPGSGAGGGRQPPRSLRRDQALHQVR